MSELDNMSAEDYAEAHRVAEECKGRAEEQVSELDEAALEQFLILLEIGSDEAVGRFAGVHRKNLLARVRTVLSALETTEANRRQLEADRYSLEREVACLTSEVERLRDLYGVNHG